MTDSVRLPKDASAVFATEAELCAAFIEAVEKERGWIAYPETAGFDILLSRVSDGVQVGIEAKLALNVKVLSQALPDGLTWNYGETGPDFRAVLVPAGGTAGLTRICGALGITVIAFRRHKHWQSLSLPSDRYSDEYWHQWSPTKRCPLPGYIPDVMAGASAPLALTDWKIRAIKLAILLELRPVTRADFKALALSPSRWTDPYTGWLLATPQGYVRGSQMPDFKAQHPRNYGEIEADFDKWAPKHSPVLKQEALAL
jgi:hypothetical protein